ncbi:MAG: hypothetical protein R2711_06520 [Acidimicrobiales bacterium]
MLLSQEIVEAHRRRLPLEPLARGSEPAERHRYLDGGGEVGVIGTVTEPFCGSCDRVASPLTASCGPASSPPRRPTCARCCARGAPTTTWPPPSRPPWPGSGPATGSPRCSSSARLAR